MTANAMKADLDACLAAGMNDYVTKPIDRNVLVATLRRWLPARSPQPSAAATTPAQKRVGCASAQKRARCSRARGRWTLKGST